MGSVGEVSGIVTALEVLDRNAQLSDESKLAFFQNLEQSFNAGSDGPRVGYEAYAREPSSAHLT